MTNPMLKVVEMKTNVYVLMHSQYTEDRKGFPWHIGALDRETKITLTDCIHNNRKENKWQVVFYGSFRECQLKMDELIKLKSKVIQ